MIGYRDRTYCTRYDRCADGVGCPRALTEEVLEAAQEWWEGDGHPPIGIFTREPSCMKRIEATEESDG